MDVYGTVKDLEISPPGQVQQAIEERAAIGALAFGFVALPAKEVFECSPGWTRKTMLAYTWIAGEDR